MKTIKQIAQFLFLASLTITLTSCPDDPSEPKPDALFEYTSGTLTAPVTVNFTNQSTHANSYLWDFGDNSFSTFESPSHQYTSGGNYSVVLKAFGAGGTDSISKIVVIEQGQVEDPIFNDDFSGGTVNWGYDNASYSIVDQQLLLQPSSTEYDPIAYRSLTPNAQLPWRYKAEVAIVTSEGGEKLPGIVCITDDEGTDAVTALWFGVMKNNSDGYNWIWLWYIDATIMEPGWYFWDDNCIGASLDIDITDWNTIEMVANVNKTFTLIVNNSPVSVNNAAFADFESLTTATVSLGVSQFWLRGAQVDTKWDNIEFEGTALTTHVEQKVISDKQQLMSREMSSSLKTTLESGNFRSLKEALQK